MSRRSAALFARHAISRRCLCSTPRIDWVSAQEQFNSRGFCHIPNFIDEAQVQQLLHEASSLNERVYSRETHTVYQEPTDDCFPPTHPRNLPICSSKQIVDFARIPLESGLRGIYSSTRELTRRVVGLPELFLSGCPYNGAYYNIFKEGDGV